MHNLNLLAAQTEFTTVTSLQDSFPLRQLVLIRFCNIYEGYRNTHVDVDIMALKLGLITSGTSIHPSSEPAFNHFMTYNAVYSLLVLFLYTVTCTLCCKDFSACHQKSLVMRL